MNRFQIIVASSVTIFFSHGFAATPELVWNESTGLSPAGKCTSTALTLHPPKSMIDFSNEVIEITDVTETLPLDDSARTLVGSFWQAVTEDGHPVMARCAQNAKDSVLFEVHFKNSNEALLVAAAADSSIFRFVRTHSTAEAEALFTTVNRKPSSTLTSGVDAFEGPFQNIICTSEPSFKVYNDALTQVLFSVPQYENVQLVQSWGTNHQDKNENGQKNRYVKVQFSQADAAQKTGWILENSIRPRSECLGTEALKATAARATSWVFPTIKRTTHNYKQGMRRFKASRSGGRLHAACDLYRIKGEAALAVTGGTVIRDRYYFYEGTYALEIKHDGGKVVRYGEITGTAASGVAKGKIVKAGQTVGYIGKVNSNCCEPMLHFEMYGGTKTGALTQSGNSFRRRSDLLDPSTYLTDWEKAKFGTAY